MQLWLIKPRLHYFDLLWIFTISQHPAIHDLSLNHVTNYVIVLRHTLFHSFIMDGVWPHDRSCCRFGMIPACDRQTVRRTESIIANTALCIASYADALWLIKPRLHYFDLLWIFTISQHPAIHDLSLNHVTNYVIVLRHTLFHSFTMDGVWPHDRSQSRFGMIPACDRQTVRRTESIIANTALWRWRAVKTC